ncbi:MAG: LysE family translocator [Alphaproteobacteria bacterium]|nr:LysE family translocator [Alphaproteobacteria bacterium]
MTYDLFIALVVFAAIAAFTPGPNNTMLMASGINFGFRSTLPLIFGVMIGFPFMIACIGLGLGKVFEFYPIIYTVMKYVGAAYMLWLAWKIATARPSGENGAAVGEPITFFQACALQWVNPKGWVMAVTSLSAYTVAASYYSCVAIVVAVAAVMGIGSATTWAMFGVGLKHILHDPRYFRLINLVLGLSLAASLIPMLWH